jgi:aspartate racemase
VILHSVDFCDIELLQRLGDWDAAGRVLAQVASSLETAGADLLVLCTNTMHKVAPAIQESVTIPLLHIADPTADEIKAAGLSTVGLLGSRFTMEHDFYRNRLQLHGIEVIVPCPPARDVVDHVIYNELCLGLVREPSRAQLHTIIQRLIDDGGQAVILGCTEIAMLIRPSDSAVPIFDTTSIHARTAAEWALAGD